MPTHTPEEIENLFKKWAAVPSRFYSCFICGERAKKITTGYLPGLGPVMKCPACREEYVEIVRSLQGVDR